MKSKRKNNGNTMLTTPVIIAIGIFAVSMLISVSIKILMPYIWYEKLSSACIKYVFLMEEYGYLTKKEAQLLKNELVYQGFDDEKLEIYYASTKAKYGEPIFLKIKYEYDIELPLSGNKVINMIVEKQSVSKK